MLLDHSRLVGSPKRTCAKALKVNQSQHIALIGNVISGADDNAIDFVSVQYARVAGNTIENANDS